MTEKEGNPESKVIASKLKKILGGCCDGDGSGCGCCGGFRDVPDKKNNSEDK